LHPWLYDFPLLLKPFRAAELLSTVREVLSVDDAAGDQIEPPN
jgi:hypothetical protein